MLRNILATAILAILVLLTACGGGSTPAAPVFSSTAPPTAAEGATYTYTLAAVAQDGSPVSYALTTAPTGASVSGDTVTWTPTWAQSRLPNQFTVAATTTAGGSASQTWTVTPTGSIHGSYINTYWTPQGPVNVAEDLTRLSVEAFLTQPDGSLQVWPATGTTQGSFTIPDVPPGNYWLKVGTAMYWTNSSTFDYGTDYVGSDSASESFANVTFNLSGLDPWAAGDNLTLVSPNLGLTSSLTGPTICSPLSCVPSSDLASGATTFSETGQQVNFDAASGSSNYILQYDWISAPLSGSVLGPALNLSSFSLNTTDSVTGALSESSLSSLDINVKGSAWAKMYTQQASLLASQGTFVANLALQPFVSDLAANGPVPGVLSNSIESSTIGFQPLIPLASLSANEVIVDQDFGTVQYNDPFPATWLPVFTASGASCVPTTPSIVGVNAVNGPVTYEPINIVNEPVTINTLDELFCVGIGYSTTSLPTGANAITPPMSPVQNPELDGVSLFTAVTTTTPTPKISWNPPTGLVPYGYNVSIIEIASSDSNLLPVVANLHTAQTSLTVPPGILSPGSSYLFVIGALADARANIASSPRRLGYPRANAQATSGPVAIGGSSSVSAASVVRAATAHPASSASGSSQSASRRQYQILDSEGNLRTVSK